MTKLVAKDFRLALHPTNILFLFLAAMVFIPNYPYYVAVFFCTLGIQFLCLSGRENQDITYTLLLPIRKGDAVRARMLTAVTLELSQLVLMVPCMLIKDRLGFPGNQAGMEVNLAFFGISLFLLGIFNWIFFTVYYRDTAKVGTAFIKAAVPFWLLLLTAEGMTFAIPFFRDRLDTRGGAYLPEKLAVLALGMLVFAGLTLLACRESIRSFEKLDQ